MITSKGIKILCYITMGMVYLLSIALLAVGINYLIDENSLSALFIAAGLILPLAITVSLYPLFALANIDKNLALISKKIAAISADKTEFPQDCTAPPAHSIEKSMPVTEEKLAPEPQRVILPQELMAFLKAKYGVSLEDSDEADVIKAKIMAIPQDTTQVNSLKNKILSAKNMEEIVSALKMHKVAHQWGVELAKPKD